MNIEEAVEKQENYSSIVDFFQNLKDFNMDELVMLIDTIDLMSPQIYEHYRSLQDKLRELIRGIVKQINCVGLQFLNKSDREKFGYVLLKGCKNGTLLSEKYKELGLILSKEQEV